MAYDKIVVEKAMSMRKEGLSVPKIAQALQVSRNTVFRWVRNVPLSHEQILLLRQNSESGRVSGLAQIRAARFVIEQQRNVEAKSEIESLRSSFDNSSWWQLVAALLFWCEGSKQLSQGIHFANSDPALVKTFLSALRRGFRVDESKFHILVHLHEYHNEQLVQKFWSDISGIPLQQFYIPYLKSHSKKQKRAGYKGCASIRHADASLARALAARYRAFSADMGGLVKWYNGRLQTGSRGFDSLIPCGQLISASWSVVFLTE
jgi:transposase-like protein